jgi:hypothetical protein
MNKVLALTLTLLVSAGVLGQKDPMKFGEIPLDDLKMTVYPADSSAEAVVLGDFGFASVLVSSTSINLVFLRHIRIKILKPDGTRWADGQVLLYRAGEQDEGVSQLKASSFILEGGKVVESKMAKTGVFREKFNKSFDVQKFTIPNAKVGSVIEYSYTVNSPYVANFPNWEFQREIPTRHSEYWAVIPEFLVMQRYMQGYVPVTNYETKDRSSNDIYEKVHHWVMTNVPAFRSEPYMTTKGDYIAKMNFALAYINLPSRPMQEVMGTWEKLARDLADNEAFGKTVTGSAFLKKDVDQIIAGKTDPMEKIQAIHAYVRDNLEWNGTKDFTADPLKKVFETKKGTSGDINLALGSMLEKAGFTVDMVMLSTRDHGMIRKEYPMTRQFNYVLAAPRVDGKPVLLDATEKLLPYTTLPERCLNGQGFVISATAPGWMNIESKVKARTVLSADLALSPDGTLKGGYQMSKEGYDGLEARSRYLSKGKEEFLKERKDEHPSWTFETSDFENTDARDKPFTEKHSVTLADHSVNAGDILYLNPFIAGQLHQNPFSLEKREYPVDFGTMKDKVYSLKLTLPEGYIVDEVPQAKMMALPGNGGRFLYNVVASGNVISVTSSLQINRIQFNQPDYPALREFYAQIVAKQAEQIVVKKK